MFTACASPRRLLLCVDITQLHCREVEVRGRPRDASGNTRHRAWIVTVYSEDPSSEFVW